MDLLDRKRQTGATLGAETGTRLLVPYGSAARGEEGFEDVDIDVLSLQP